MAQQPQNNYASGVARPSAPFMMMSWLVLAISLGAFFIGMYNVELGLGEKGFYISNFLFGLFAAVSIQKNVRDRLENIPVTDAYFGIAWAAVLASISMFVIGMINVELGLAEKGFYIMAFTMGLFATITTQKNVRDSR